MKQKIKTIWKKFKCVSKEALNLFTNLFTPVLSLFCLLAEALQLPSSFIKFLKKVEYWCWNASGTSKYIDDFIEQVDDVVDDMCEGDEE